MYYFLILVRNQRLDGAFCHVRYTPTEGWKPREMVGLFGMKFIFIIIVLASFIFIASI
jgi:hypothetical protein